ncbi:DUF6283 family protein [Actinomadura violacea]|uniref:Uncharacterized protein n=1 Tax=Actinomadura violacea TaxID=2819934 RepID=A0ABS3RWK5_9ACTN|nr:DUF6283 family protein [Actinomadura violacea]MBO2461141.1 hypothetical protein [Actinomadura violacea]
MKPPAASDHGAPPPLPRCTRPCRACPWRVDTIGRIRFPNIAEYAAGTIGRPGEEAPLGALLFGCHAVKAEPGWLCAGWLAVVGRDHLTVRYAVALGALPAAALTPGRDWPALFPTYSAMEAAHHHALTSTETF